VTETKNRKCTGKRRHDTRRKAMSALYRLVRRGAFRPLLNVYACEHCAGWHLGHRPGRRKR
jgi:hypothetical protein